MSRRASSLTATDPHIVVIGHITATELRRRLTESDIAGGFVNRFLPVVSCRSKRLPSDPGTPEDEIQRLGGQLGKVLAESPTFGRLCRSSEADRLWVSRYPDLTPDGVPETPYASVIARAVPQVIRLSTLYALIDVSPVIEIEHLRAAFAVWDYVDASAYAIFGDMSVHAGLTKLMTALDLTGDAGMSRTDISKVFANNKPAAELDELLRQALNTGRYERLPVVANGRTTATYRRAYENNELTPVAEVEL